MFTAHLNLPFIVSVELRICDFNDRNSDVAILICNTNTIWSKLVYFTADDVGHSNRFVCEIFQFRIVVIHVVELFRQLAGTSRLTFRRLTISPLQRTERDPWWFVVSQTGYVICFSISILPNLDCFHHCVHVCFIGFEVVEFYYFTFSDRPKRR